MRTLTVLAALVVVLVAVLGLSRRLNVELLQYLHREREVGALQQRAGNRGLRRLTWVRADRVQQYVRVNESHGRAPGLG